MDIPSNILRAELARRHQSVQINAGDGAEVFNDVGGAEATATATATEVPACGSRGSRGSYNTTLHVLALFLILILSTLGMFIIGWGTRWIFNFPIFKFTSGVTT